MLTLLFVGCVLAVTILTDAYGFALRNIPEGYEDEFGFHFGSLTQIEIE
jgi:hypothetical protein